MTTKTWRDVARAVIQKALAEAEAQGLDKDATKRHVNAAYPFGERAYHPYRIWLSEMKNTFNPANPIAPTPANLTQRKAQNDALSERAELIAQGQMELL